MTEKELKKLSRSELLQMLIEQIKKNEELKEQLRKARWELESRRISIQNAGSIAEASLLVNDIFQIAQAAADQYLENVKLLAKENSEINEDINNDNTVNANEINAKDEI